MHLPSRWRSILRFAPPALLALAVLLYAIYFSYLTILRYHAFEARALDMGNLHQAIWNTAHGNWFRMTNQEAGLTSRLSMHVEPILLPIAALYRLLPGVETLLVLQASVVALGALPLYALTRRQQLGDWPALAFAGAYLLNPTIQAANWLEFHPLTLAPTFLMAAFYFLATRRNGWFVLFALLAAGCKEEIGLLVAMLGLYAWLVQRRSRFGLITILLGSGWSLLAVLGIQTAFAGGNIHWGRYAYLGETTGAKLLALVTRPDLLITQLQSAGIGSYFYELLLPVGFLSLAAPEVLLLALPSLAINLLAQFSPMHQVTTLIYAAPILPFVMLSAVMGAARLVRWAGRQWPFARRRAAWPGLVAVWLLAAALLGQHLYGYLPGGGNTLSLAVSDHQRRGQVIFGQIPAEAAVSAQDRLNPHVAGRKTLYIYPRVEDADYVLLDVTASAWPQHPNDLHRSAEDLLQNGYGVAAADDGYLLLRKGESSKTPAPAFYTAWQAVGTPAPDAIQSGAVFGDLLQLQEYRVRSDRYGEVVVDLVWTAQAALDRDLRFFVGYYDHQGNLLHDNIYYQPVSVLWYPTSLWTPGQRILVQTLPWRLDEEGLNAEQFVLGVGVYSGEEGWTEGTRLPVTAAGGAPVLEEGTLLRLGGFQRTAGGGWQAQPVTSPPYAELPLQPLDARFGIALLLTAAAQPAAGQAGHSLPLRLRWERHGDAPPHLSRFVHLLDANGVKVAQVDGQVVDAFGPLPVESWPPQTVVEDLVRLALPAELPAGEYTLVAGLYDWQSGERLAANGAAARPDGAVQLGGVRITQ